MSDVAPSVSSSAWQREGVRGFSVARGEPLADAVRRDLAERLSEDGELPTPERYLDAVDPARDRESAVAVVVAAFDAAPRFRRELAAAWRARHPSWGDAIERAAALAILDEEPDGCADAPQRLGPALDDGLGRYELLELIGRGSSGAVHRALDRSLARCGSESFVAVKRIRCGPDEIDGRLREAGAARAIAHAGVARVLDAGRDAQGVFIVTELIAGVPLYIWKALAPDRDAVECERIVAAAQAALLACHARGVAHGDLSPANLLIDAEGAPRVVDFGHASWGRSEDEAATARDHRRLAGILRWLLRGVEESPARRRAVANIARVARGEPLLGRTGSRVGVAALTATVVIACAAAVVLWVAWPTGEGGAPEIAAGGGASERAARADPLGLVFGSSLATRPELERVLRDLLLDGIVGVPVESLEALRVGLRAEASAIAGRPASGGDDGALLLASALLELTGDEIPWAAPLAVLAAERDEGSASRVLLAQAIVDIARIRSGGADALEDARGRLERVRVECGATGLEVVAEHVSRFVPSNPPPPDAVRRNTPS
jgi:hypothetical protein